MEPPWEPPCSRCNEILGQVGSVADAQSGKVIFRRDSNYLAATEANTCPLCSTLVLKWGKHLPKDAEFAVRLENLDGDTPKLHVIAAWEQASRPTVSYLIYAARADPGAARVKARPVNLDVASPESFEQANSWIASCNVGHTECSDWMSNTMPLRLIDVSPSFNDCVTLCQIRGQFHRFVALSYCWGETRFLTTRSVNLRLHMRGIPLSSLPLTIRDAIHHTRQLGFRYIWVDALCIVQDDDMEKHRDISRMKDFYRSAHLTSSAASAGACQAGFLHKRQSCEPGFEMRVTCSNGQRGQLRLVEQQQPPHPRTVLVPGAEPISYRAWTTQESLLSS